MSKEEVVAMEVEAPVVEKKKKSKKVKKTEEVDEVATLKRKAQEEHEDAPKKKKSKKDKKAAAEAEEEKPMEVEETPAAEEGEKKKKKKKKSKTAEEEAPAATEEPAAEEEGEKKKKKKKKSKDAEPAPEMSPEESGESEDKAEEKAEEKEEEKEEAAEEEEKVENLTVFVGGLPWSAEEETVKKDFEECGEIKDFRFLTDRETGRPKGSCFIDYMTSEGVKKALEFNETEYGGRQIFVRMANDESHKGKGKKGKGKDGKGKGKKGKGALREPGEKPEGCKSLIIKNFSYSSTEDSLWSLFEGCGEIERLKMLTDRETGESKGIAFVDFAEESGAEAGIKKCNTELDGRMVFVDWSGPKEKGDGKKGKGKDGKKGKGKKGKGKKGADPVRSANQGSIVESTGAKKTFDDSDSD